MTEARCGYCGSDMVSMVHSPTCAMITKECPSCARHAAKMKDREGLARAIYKASNDFQTDESIRWPNNWKDEWPQYIADAVIRWMEE